MQIEAVLEHSATRFPDKTALVCDGRRLTYSWLAIESRRLASAISEQGIRRGERVAFCLDNSVDAVVCIFATLMAGGVLVPVNATMRVEKLTRLLNDSGARLLFGKSARARDLEACLRNAPAVEKLVITGAESEAESRDHRVCGLEAFTREASGARSMQPGIDQDLAAIIYTSGSTGSPKGVMLSHLNMVSAANSVIEYLGNNEGDIILDVLPLSFSYGLYQVLTAFKVGATLVLERSFAYPHAVVQRLIDERATGFAIVPTIAAVLLQLQPDHDFPSLRYLTNAGAALPAEHVPRLRKLFPHSQLYLMYGLTECKRVCYLAPDQVDQRPASVGKPMPNVEAYVVDEAGRRLPPGEVGELVVRGSNVMRGYWNLPEETEKALRPGPIPGERVLYTGDLFKMDDEGYLYFVGRRDDMIKSRGEKVSPAEIENILHRLSGVSMAAVVGIPHPVQGVMIKAFIVVTPGMTLTENEVLRHCARHLEDYMVPKVVEFRESFPRTESGKIDKLQLVGRNEP